MESYTYNVDVNWESSRKGIICSPELNKEKGFCIDVATPTEFPKGMKGIWSPEHLFVASVSSCLMTTFLAIAENSTLDFQHFSCKAIGKLEMTGGKLMMSEIKLKPTLVIRDEQFINKGLRILKKAEDACLISHSVKSKITMEVNIEVKSLLIESK